VGGLEVPGDDGERAVARAVVECGEFMMGTLGIGPPF
jgi:hypothetical protein